MKMAVKCLKFTAKKLAMITIAPTWYLTLMEPLSGTQALKHFITLLWTKIIAPHKYGAIRLAQTPLQIS